MLASSPSCMYQLYSIMGLLDYPFERKMESDYTAFLSSTFTPLLLATYHPMMEKFQSFDNDRVDAECLLMNEIYVRRTAVNQLDYLLCTTTICDAAST